MSPDSAGVRVCLGKRQNASAELRHSHIDPDLAGVEPREFRPVEAHRAGDEATKQRQCRIRPYQDAALAITTGAET
jgi:hypothetical protein